MSINKKGWGAVAFVLAACAPDDPIAPQVDALPYIAALCEEYAAKCEACVPIPDNWKGPCDVEECAEIVVGNYDGDPCFLEQRETAFCGLDRSPCDEFFAMDFDTIGPPCGSKWDVLFECLSRNDAWD